MQEIKKQSIVIASILKPLDDTRMLEKMGKCLELSGLWSVHIVGYGKTIQSDSIHLHGLGEFNRLSFKRLFSQISVFRKLIQIRPKVVIINTHELLNTIFIYKILFGCRVLYDIRENYCLNILHTSAFPNGMKQLIALWVRFVEWILSPFIDHFILAEASYQKELKFIGTRFTIIENKCMVPVNFKRKPIDGKIRLLFTGTIDKTTGIEEVIELVKKLYAIDKRVELRIVGYCARQDYRDKITKAVSGLPFISIYGFTTLVSHTLIFDEIAEATAGVIYYPPSVHNRDRIPTKAYEYLACELPILYDHSTTWGKLVSNHQAGIEIDFNNLNPNEVLEALSYSRFYPKAVEIAHWKSESRKFMSVINS